MNTFMHLPQTDIQTGLSSQQVQALQTKYGPNRISRRRAHSLFIVFLSQFVNPLIYVLVLAASLIYILGFHSDAFFISGVLFFNALLGTLQEGRTRSILESLKRYLTHKAVVLRNGETTIISAQELVPGDIIEVQAGDRIPADAYILKAYNLQVDEAMLTGESTPVIKTEGKIPFSKTTMKDLGHIEQSDINKQAHVLFSGSYVLTGKGKAIVISTGNATQLGKLNVAVETIQTETPLKKSIDELAHRILIAICVLCVFLFLLGLWAGKPMKELLVIITALFICVVPEGLPIVFTLTLVSGAYRMTKKQIVTKRMQAIEGLGRANILVIDKTGTLTRNEMLITSLYVDNVMYAVTGEGYHIEGCICKHDLPITRAVLTPDLELLLQTAALLSHVQIQYQHKTDTFTIKGDPTEAALQVLAKKMNIYEDTREKFETLHLLPFSTEHKYQAGLYKHKNKYILLVTGAPEIVLAACKHVDQKAKDALHKMLSEGLRVVAAAYTMFEQAPSNHDIHTLIHNLTFLGLYGMQDTIRKDAHQMVAQAHQAGLRVVMVTGDHLATALFAARKIGIYEQGNTALDKTMFEKLLKDKDHVALHNALKTTTVFSRMTPDQKVALVQAYKDMGYIVAMTGDGVNDAPALVAADLGIAMGHAGTEVAKQASDLILLNDSFESIIDAIKEGRTIYLALRRVVLYFFTTNLAEIWLLFFAFFFSYPLPILAPQILWINLVTDGFLDAALSQEPEEADILNPYHAQANSLLNTQSWFKIFLLSLPMGIISLAIFIWYLPYDLALARTMTMTTLASCQWLNALNCRSEKYSIFALSPFSNPWLVVSIIVILFLQVSMLYIPPLQNIFHTVPLSAAQWGLVFLVASPIILIEEIRKLIMRKSRKSAKTST